MIECIEDRRERLLDVRKVHDPAEMLIYWTRNVDFDTERMAVNARALVTGRYEWQAVRCLDLECLEQIHAAPLQKLARVGEPGNKVVARGGIEPPTSAL